MEIADRRRTRRADPRNQPAIRDERTPVQNTLFTPPAAECIDSYCGHCAIANGHAIAQRSERR